MTVSLQEERKRKSADDSSADGSRTPNVYSTEADNPDMTSSQKFKDDTSNAPAKEGAKMSKSARTSVRNSSKGDSKEGEQVKEKSESPIPKHETGSGSSSSSHSPSPEKTSRSRRGHSSRGGAKKGDGRRGSRRDRSRSSSSSPEEIIPKKKQRHRTNSSSHSGSRSPEMVSSERPTRRFGRHSNTALRAIPDHVQDIELPHDGSGDKSVEQNDSAGRQVTTTPKRKWRKKSAEATTEVPPGPSETDQSKEHSDKSTRITTSDSTKESKDSKELVTVGEVAEPESASRISITEATKVEEKQSSGVEKSSLSNTGAQESAAMTSDKAQDTEQVFKSQPQESESASESADNPNEPISRDSASHTRNNGLYLSKKNGEKSRTSVEEVTVSPSRKENRDRRSSSKSRRQRNRSYSSDSSSEGSRSKSSVRKEQSGSRSSSSSSSDSQSRSRSSSSGSSTDASLKKESKVSGHKKTEGNGKPLFSSEGVAKSDKTDIESSRKKSAIPRKTEQYGKDDRTPVQSVESGEPKSRGQEEKLGKEQESRSYEAKEKQQVIQGGQDASSGKMAELMDKSKADSVNNADADEETVAKKGIKKRKWGSKTSKAAKTTKRTTSMEISSDVLKNLIGDVKLTETVFDMENEVVNTLDYDEPEEDQRDVKVKRNVTQSPHTEELKTEQEDARRVETRDDYSPEQADILSEPDKKIIKLSSAAPKVGLKMKLKEGKKRKDEKKKEAADKENKDNAVDDKDTKDKVVAIMRPIKTLLPEVDEPEPVSSSHSPARNPPDRVIRIAGLVRPFTVGQLKELLRRTGELNEEYFWINGIKSNCLATYKTQEEAVATRAALHGTRWPQSNPKILVVDFATIEDVIHRKAEGDVPLPALVKKPQEAQKKLKEQKTDVEKEKKQKGKDHREKGRVERKKEERDTRDRRREAEKKIPVREWDRDKIQQLSRSRSKSKQRDRITRRSRSRDRERKRGDQNKEKKEEDRRKEKKQKDTKADEEPPAKLLDDLFRKTKATPCIYWLPLTEEQAQQRLAKRLEQEKERQKRVAAAEEREKEELRKREAARLERQRERERTRDKSRERDKSKQERSRSSRSSSRSRSRRRR